MSVNKVVEKKRIGKYKKLVCFYWGIAGHTVKQCSKIKELKKRQPRRKVFKVEEEDEDEDGKQGELRLINPDQSYCLKITKNGPAS